MPKDLPAQAGNGLHEKTKEVSYYLDYLELYRNSLSVGAKGNGNF